MAEPTRVGDLLAALPGLAERLVVRLAETRLLRAWPTVAGPAALRSRAERIEGGVLHVAVEGSGWLHRLTLEEADVLARCREIADIHAVRFRLAPSGAGAPEETALRLPPPARLSDPPIRAEGDRTP